MNNNFRKNDSNNESWNNIPPRWLKCPRRGEVVAGIQLLLFIIRNVSLFLIHFFLIIAKFVPFKTPLDERYISQIPASDLFTPQMFISCLSTYKVYTNICLL